MKKIQTIDLPVLPLRGLMIFPNMVLHFDVGRKKSVAALEEGMTGSQKVFLVSQKQDDTEDPGFGDLCRVGTIAEIRQVMNLPGRISACWWKVRTGALLKKHWATNRA